MTPDRSACCAFIPSFSLPKPSGPNAAMLGRAGIDGAAVVASPGPVVDPVILSPLLGVEWTPVWLADLVHPAKSKVSAKATDPMIDRCCIVPPLSVVLY